ncbi:pyridoxamine 5'-phosphate oxidase family protein [Paenibacillus sp. HN-1]|uniref:pyridoxamine 5'-phosphate oxidase family protein n=1 Tax=Paenibacillus TaxID=44249 RepID=UPI001CA9CE13|nr:MULTISPECIES: pyridoxamine 5'-phosphate oxidase family protein [Paenibacillus]MBY9080666.1 pyridoxamine 5'-phosphate oxidase family protein [Paenibacillus sp. CGMCC 1.18879]MBY9085389.1 pyridoxamine 5'-phosphate oxidase family protein [Paenibacillus sinensis]
MSDLNKSHQEAVKTVRELIKGIDTAMFTTISDEGLVSRPMKTQEVEFDGDLWFLTKKDTSKFDEILHDPRVNVVYADKSFVSIRGTAKIVENVVKKKEFWNAGYEAFLKTGYDDPDVILIQVHAEAAEYWKSGNLAEKATYLFRRITNQDTERSNLNQTVEL